MNNFTDTQTQTCPMCDLEIRVEHVSETMEYATTSGIVNLDVVVPYEVCDACGYRGFGEAGEKARTNAIYKFHQRLTPTEIVEMRNDLGLSQFSYAEALGVGHASIERWELGATMQNLSMNNLMLLLAKRGQLEWLQDEKKRRCRKDEREKSVVSLNRFRCLTVAEESSLLESSSNFKLRVKA